MNQTQLETYRTGMEARYLKIKNNKQVAEEKGIAYYKKFLDNTARHNIKTIVVISPTILKDPFYLDNQALEKQLIMDIAKTYPNVVFLDYSSDARFYNHPEKFSDVFHLNRQGAEEYSTAFAQYIKTNHLAE